MNKKKTSEKTELTFSRSFQKQNTPRAVVYRKKRTRPKPLAGSTLKRLSRVKEKNAQ